MPTTEPLKQTMSEAEVSLLLAIHLVASERASSDVQVALDGAQVKIGNNHHFNVVEFMQARDWLQEQTSVRWQCKYTNARFNRSIVVHSQSGRGDVTAELGNGVSLLVESKKGTLTNSKSSSEYPLIREAIGQLITLESIPAKVQLAVAVPHGERFVKLAERWRKVPLVVRTGIRLLTVSPTGEVDGW